MKMRNVRLEPILYSPIFHRKAGNVPEVLVPGDENGPEAQCRRGDPKIVVAEHQVPDGIGIQQGGRHQVSAPGAKGSLWLAGRCPWAINCSSSSTHSAG